MASNNPKLYEDYASFWPLLSAPEDYEVEAEFYSQTFQSFSSNSVKTVLELGSGGGNNACHMKAHFDLTLVDLSAGMLKVSEILNPECEHIEADMRNLRLEKTFDAVFVHDAIMYMTTHEDLKSVMETAFAHCKPGGITLFAPDFVKEDLHAYSDHGGVDAEDRGIRYLEWVWDPDPDDTEFLGDFVYMIRAENQEMNIVYDRHHFGIFSHDVWMSTLKDVGFETFSVPIPEGDEPVGTCEIFVGIKSD
jgi:SAM-dependent methyltransferase